MNHERKADKPDEKYKQKTNSLDEKSTAQSTVTTPSPPQVQPRLKIIWQGKPWKLYEDETHNFTKDLKEPAFPSSRKIDISLFRHLVSQEIFYSVKTKQVVFTEGEKEHKRLQKNIQIAEEKINSFVNDWNQKNIQEKVSCAEDLLANLFITSVKNRDKVEYKTFYNQLLDTKRQWMNCQLELEAFYQGELLFNSFIEVKKKEGVTFVEGSEYQGVLDALAEKHHAAVIVWSEQPQGEAKILVAKHYYRGRNSGNQLFHLLLDVNTKKFLFLKAKKSKEEPKYPNLNGWIQASNILNSPLQYADLVANRWIKYYFWESVDALNKILIEDETQSKLALDWFHILLGGDVYSTRQMLMQQIKPIFMQSHRHMGEWKILTHMIEFLKKQEECYYRKKVLDSKVLLIKADYEKRRITLSEEIKKIEKECQTTKSNFESDTTQKELVQKNTSLQAARIIFFRNKIGAIEQDLKNLEGKSKEAAEFTFLMPNQQNSIDFTMLQKILEENNHKLKTEMEKESKEKEKKSIEENLHYEFQLIENIKEKAFIDYLGKRSYEFYKDQEKKVETLAKNIIELIEKERKDINEVEEMRSAFNKALNNFHYSFYPTKTQNKINIEFEVIALKQKFQEKIDTHEWSYVKPNDALVTELKRPDLNYPDAISKFLDKGEEKFQEYARSTSLKDRWSIDLNSEERTKLLKELHDTLDKTIEQEISRFKTVFSREMKKDPIYESKSKQAYVDSHTAAYKDYLVQFKLNWLSPKNDLFFTFLGDGKITAWLTGLADKSVKELCEKIIAFRKWHYAQQQDFEKKQEDATEDFRSKTDKWLKEKEKKCVPDYLKTVILDDMKNAQNARLALGALTESKERDLLFFAKTIYKKSQETKIAETQIREAMKIVFKNGNKVRELEEECDTYSPIEQVNIFTYQLEVMPIVSEYAYWVKDGLLDFCEKTKLVIPKTHWEQDTKRNCIGSLPFVRKTIEALYQAYEDKNDILLKEKVAKLRGADNLYLTSFVTELQSRTDLNKIVSVSSSAELALKKAQQEVISLQNELSSSNETIFKLQKENSELRSQEEKEESNIEKKNVEREKSITELRAAWEEAKQAIALERIERLKANEELGRLTRYIKELQEKNAVLERSLNQQIDLYEENNKLLPQPNPSLASSRNTLFPSHPETIELDSPGKNVTISPMSSSSSSNKTV